MKHGPWACSKSAKGGETTRKILHSLMPHRLRLSANVGSQQQQKHRVLNLAKELRG